MVLLTKIPRGLDRPRKKRSSHWLGDNWTLESKTADERGAVEVSSQIKETGLYLEKGEWMEYFPPLLL